MQALWNQIKAFPAVSELKPLKGTEYINVHTAEENGYHFSLGAAVVKHRGILRVSFGNSWRLENDDRTVLTEKYSADGGKTWQSALIAATEDSYGRSHGVYLERDGELYSFYPVAQFDAAKGYLNLKMEAYRLGASGEYERLGIALDADFWPMCEPMRLENGSLLMAGLETDNAQAAVALCHGNDLLRWEMKILPNPNGYKYWGETTVLKYPDRLLAIVRGGKGTKTVLVSESRDGGDSWTGLEESNFPIANSKMYAGTLSNGLRYLVFSLSVKGHRDVMAIAVGKDLFERAYVIRNGFDAPGKFYNNQWCYPYAYEDVENKLLYVAYTKNKEDCEMIRIPVDSLSLCDEDEK